MVTLLQLLKVQRKRFLRLIQRRRKLSATFSSVFSKEPHDNFDSLPLRPLAVDTCGLMIRTTFDAVMSKLAKIKINKSAGPTYICPKVLFELRHGITTPLGLLQIFERLFKSKVVPADWKQADIVPIFRKKNKLNNYRPVSVTCR